MNFAVIDAGLVVKLLLLLLLGMGPKIALVPFLEKTKNLDAETQRAVGRRMVVTAVVTAIVLFATGWLLLRLLHISGGAVAVGGAIVLAILAITMATEPTKKVEAMVWHGGRPSSVVAAIFDEVFTVGTDEQWAEALADGAI